MSNIIHLPTGKPPADPEFYTRLQIPPGILEWLRYHPDCAFTVIADPVTGKLAGVVRKDLFDALLAAAKGAA